MILLCEFNHIVNYRINMLKIFESSSRLIIFSMHVDKSDIILCFV